MRTPRLLGQGTAHYHCISRVVDRRKVFGPEEKEHFCKLMRGMEALTGVQVIGYCVMSNHFHLLLEVPDAGQLKLADQVTDGELLELVRPLLGDEETQLLGMELANCDAHGLREKKNQLRDKYLRQRGDLSLFMKGLKQRFTQWYNRRAGRKGTLWEERFKSIHVENDMEALLTTAAYIDLNPIRAKMVSDPSDYRWSSYGEACGGSRRARRGLAVALEWHPHYEGKRVTWREVGAQYRKILFGAKGMSGDGRALSPGASEAERQEALRELASGGRLPRAKALRCRVRYFTDGLVLGSKEFVEGVFQANRGCFGQKRESGARKMGGAEWGKLKVMRDLRKTVYS